MPLLAGLLAIDLYLAKLFAAMAMGKVISHNFGWKKLSPQAVFFGGLWLYKTQLWAKKE
ncbi:MAG: hypothetical protein U1C50_04575 [Patescibacteria group bacterium]|nr:hypothetical protein [Patescibacteria group bacterium]